VQEGKIKINKSNVHAIHAVMTTDFINLPPTVKQPELNFIVSFMENIDGKWIIKLRQYNWLFYLYIKPKSLRIGLDLSSPKNPSIRILHIDIPKSLKFKGSIFPPDILDEFIVNCMDNTIHIAPRKQKIGRILQLAMQCSQIKKFILCCNSIEFLTFKLHIYLGKITQALELKIRFPVPPEIINLNHVDKDTFKGAKRIHGPRCFPVFLKRREMIQLDQLPEKLCLPPGILEVYDV